MDLTEYNFELFERINQYDNDRVDVVKMVVNPDTGVFIALRLPDRAKNALGFRKHY